jgi:predicted PurR-regulated permease PerM
VSQPDPAADAATPPENDALHRASPREIDAAVRPPRPIDAFNLRTPQTLVSLADFTWRALVVGLGLLALLYLVNLVSTTAIALFFALIVTALAGPIVRLLDRWLPHTLSTVVTLLGMAAVVVIVLVFVAKSIVEQAAGLTEALTHGFTQIEQWLRNGPLHWTDAQISTQVTNVEQWATGQIGTVLSSVSGLFDLVTAASVFFFAGFFFLKDGPAIWDWVVGWFPARLQPEADDAGVLAWQTLSGYTRGIIVVALADGILVYIGLQILGIPLAPVLAVLVFFGALIPVIGAPIATLMAAVVALATVGPWKALLVVGLTVLVGSFDGDVLQPLIMGRAVSLHPLAIVTLIAVGGLSFGVVGALIAVPVGATVYVLAKYLTGRIPPPGSEPEEPPEKRSFWRWNRGTGMQAAQPPG